MKKEVTTKTVFEGKAYTYLPCEVYIVTKYGEFLEAKYLAMLEDEEHDNDHGQCYIVLCPEFQMVRVEDCVATFAKMTDAFTARHLERLELILWKMVTRGYELVCPETEEIKRDFINAITEQVYTNYGELVQYEKERLFPMIEDIAKAQFEKYEQIVQKNANHIKPKRQ